MEEMDTCLVAEEASYIIVPNSSLLILSGLRWPIKIEKIDEDVAKWGTLINL